MDSSYPEIKNKEQADKLKGHLIYIETKYLPSLMTDEFYYKDLRGLQIKIEEYTKRFCESCL